MALSIRTAPAFAASRPSVSRPAAAPRPRIVRTVAKSGGDNIYHDRDTTRSRKSNPGGTKDGNTMKSEKDQQFKYQQERLEWRRKNQTGGDAYEDREEPPHNNMAHDMSAERRGPEVEGTKGHGDTLKDLVDNITGKKKKEDK